ncbi:NAD(P)/FAD-dependent oxidoreductase [Futiania mangrovi]|uniref:FAD-binding oxidoreductase n=1 Tax=Futiania mangrovi TaxID=2959716 RepID=A0A9J6PEI3_9PROT|nr:FAD-binding oxidoreductase [Futiania mangrovii]MCP1337097.1 FAD-binding oxidoreductase [Futiania mangrovii]
MGSNSDASSEGADFWNASAGRPLPDLPALKGDLECEVAVVGGGFSGLSAAHHLAEAGADVALFEGDMIGRGASGRTAGMAGTRYKKGWAALAAAYGNEEARRLHAMMNEALDTLRGLVSRYGAEDALQVGGQLIPAHTPEAFEALAADAEWLRREVGEEVVELLDADATERAVGARGYRGAWFDPRGGGLQPVEFLRAVAGGMHAAGRRLFCKSPVTSIEERADAVILTTPAGRVRAGQVILATNAYTPRGLVAPDVSRRMVPVASSILVTAPLSRNVAASILPGGRVASDTKRLLHAYRILPGDRLLFSGRADITGRRASDPASYAELEKCLRDTFPQITEPQIDYRWSGFVGVTRDGFPHVGRLGKRLVYAMGYGGRGVVLSHLLGRYAAAMALGTPVEAGPLGARGFVPWPFHGLRIPAMQAMTWLYMHQDRRDVARALRP